MIFRLLHQNLHWEKMLREWQKWNHALNYSGGRVIHMICWKNSPVCTLSVVSGYCTKAIMILVDCALFKKCLLYIDMSESKLCEQKFLL